ncbi:hypothetical protein FGO68_gene2359 [Halteria grandinella]|uniref:TLDc domain-containing protein n=1 Tax=Halteria grandinella TaxID=5974 RepID=A0A8J8NR64_HALGN|nr:hypothetical protein FGO68_gene2359 [Halteria grandinella]
MRRVQFQIRKFKDNMERAEDQQPQSKNKESTYEQISRQQENMQLCNCGSEEKVMFQCEKVTCPSYESQKLYCPECSTEEKHPHASTFIAKKSKNVTNEWNNLRQAIKNLNMKVSDWMDTHESLVELLDSFLTNSHNGEESLQIKVDQVKDLSAKIETFYQEHVSENSAKGEIIRLQQLNPSLIAFKERLESLEFLNNIGPSVLWRVYSEILNLVSHQGVLEKFSQADLEIFLKLKLYKVQLSLHEVGRERQMATNNFREFLENPDIAISQIIASLKKQLQLAPQKVALEVIDAIKIDAIRSELEAIGVSLMFSGLQEQFKEHKAKVLQTLNDQERKHEQRYQELSERVSKHLQMHQKIDDEKAEEIKQQQENQRLKQLQIEEERKKRILDSLSIDDKDKENKIAQFFAQAGRPFTQSVLLYRGSVDGNTASAFHQKCDNKNNTLTIVKTSEGKIMGGFTTQTWNSGGNYKQDANAWIFNIDAPSIFKVNQGDQYSIYTHSTYGPTFGQAHALVINECGGSACYVNGSSYQYSSGVGNLLLTKGIVSFTVKEIEVHAV